LQSGFKAQFLSRAAIVRVDCSLSTSSDLSTSGRHCAKIGATRHNAADTAVVSAGYLGSVLLVLRRGTAAASGSGEQEKLGPFGEIR
jgi:hypothetical protein